MAHVGTYEYWVQLALKRATACPLIDEQNRVLVEIDEAERAVPKMVIYYDPAIHTPESLGCGPGIELVARVPYEIQPVLIDREDIERPKCTGCGERSARHGADFCTLIYHAPNRYGSSRVVRRKGQYCRACAARHDEWVNLPFELDVLPNKAFDAESPVAAVWGQLEPGPLMSAGGCTRREVRCPHDLDPQTSMMQAFCWPTAVHPYRWPS